MTFEVGNNDSDATPKVIMFMRLISNDIVVRTPRAPARGNNIIYTRGQAWLLYNQTMILHH